MKALHMTSIAAVAVFLASACSWGSRSHSRGAPTKTSALTVVETPTPPFRVPRYDTSGTYPQVRSGEIDLRAVNAALREAVLADQRQYALSARRSAKVAGEDVRGVYETSVDRRLLSMSTVVVSALIPALKVYPGGNDGQTWLSVTVRVPTGAPVRMTDLLADPSRALPVFAESWKAQAQRTGLWPCVAAHQSDYLPTARNYFRYFALTPHGIAVGFPQEPACSRVTATVPYAVLRPYLSKLGARLIAGVRRPRG